MYSWLFSYCCPLLLQLPNDQLISEASSFVVILTSMQTSVTFEWKYRKPVIFSSYDISINYLSMIESLFWNEDSLPSHGPSLHGSCIVASKPEQLVSLAALHEHKAPPAGAGLSQYLNFCFIPGPQTSLHLENLPSLHPPSTINVSQNIHNKGSFDHFFIV